MRTDGLSIPFWSVEEVESAIRPALEQIEITNLENSTFFAQLTIRQSGELIEVDSRPSDAIALGIASSVPIFVAEHVLDEVCG